MSPREKVVAKPGKFLAGDIVQTLPEGLRWEVEKPVANPGVSDANLVFRCRPAWTEDIAFPDDRDHVVERELPRVEAEDPAVSKLRQVEGILRRREGEDAGAVNDIHAIGEIRGVLGMGL